MEAGGAGETPYRLRSSSLAGGEDDDRDVGLAGPGGEGEEEEDDSSAGGDSSLLAPRRRGGVPSSAPAGHSFPLSVYLIVGTELCERYSFYGLRGILTPYLKDELGYSPAATKSIFQFSLALAYGTAPVGGYISDTYWGKYRTVFVFALVYLLGCGTLALTAVDPQRWGMFLAVGLIGLGSGGIKPCVSTFGADQLRGFDAHAVTRYFLCFYFAINSVRLSI